MKTELSLVQLATELERQREQKKDYVASHDVIKAFTSGGGIGVRVGDDKAFGITQHARRQLADKLGIPFQYFQRLEEDHPTLLVQNVNHLMERDFDNDQRYMIRVLDGNVRGILSDRYRPLDNFDLASAVLPVLQHAGAKIESCAVTETKMYIKARCPWLERELPIPAGFKMGEGHNIFLRRIEGAVSITNSEVGAGMISVSPAVFERACTNLAVFRDEGFGRVHIGKKITGEDPVLAYLSDETKRLDDAVVWAKVRDVVKAAMDGRALEAIVAKMEIARGNQITGNPVKVVEVFSKKMGLSEDEKGGVLRHLINGGELSQYGMQWAVTRLAGDAKDYDRASELERLGGQVIELAANDWQVIAEAA